MDEPLPRLRLLPNDELPPSWAARLQPDAQQDVVRLFGHHPELFTAWQAFYGPLMRDGAVPMRVKELMRLRIAQLNECQL
ncbi:MAG: carboxymuconolactone decarboxylase family protein [Dehalococcoidia bacterium]